MSTLHQFLTDKQIATVALLFAADFVFGVGAAIATRTFDITRLGAIGFDDGVKKVLPWLGLYVFSKAAPGDFVGGINFSTIAQAYFGVICAQLAGSLLNSFQDLGFPIPAQLARFGIGRQAQWNLTAAPVNDQGDVKPKSA
jgi:hypothetical protein